MGQHIHKLTNKNFEQGTAICTVDGPVGLAVYGNTYRCEVAHKATTRRMRKDRNGTYRNVKSLTCSKCGFVGQVLAQMDLDHINGDRTDHRPDNLQTLCANCHRLKSYAPALWAGA